MTLFPIPKVSQTEAWLLRVLFAFALIHFLPPTITQTTQPVPVGLAHFFDLTWMANAESYAAFRALFYIVAFAYASGRWLVVSLPLLTILHVLPYTLINSQAHPHHGYQVLSLTLLALSVAVVCTSIRARLRGETSSAIATPKSNPIVEVWVLPIVAIFAAGRLFRIWLASGLHESIASWCTTHFDPVNALRLVTVASLVVFILLAVILRRFTEPRGNGEGMPGPETNAWQLMAGQLAIAGAYVTSVCSKLLKSGGDWFINSHNVALDFVKTTRQSYYSGLDPALKFDPPGVAFLLNHEWFARAFFSSGVIMEVVILFAIGTRRFAFLIGILMIFMHRAIMTLMTLTFHTNEAALALFYVNVPFLVAWLMERNKKPALGAA